MNMVVTVLVMVILIYSTTAVSVAQEYSERLNVIEEENMEELLVTEDPGLCQRVHVKDCTITMKKMVTPVMVRKCLTGKVVGETGLCHGGVRNKCSIRYHTRCHSKMVYQVIEEDVPKCKVETVKSCPTNTTIVTSNLTKCREVEVMRCQIVKRKVRRGRPQSSCSRLPSKLCVKKICQEEEKEEEERCYLVVKMVKQLRPEEECKIEEKKKCDKGLRRKVKKTLRGSGELQSKFWKSQP